MSETAISARLTRGKDGQPIVSLIGGPFHDYECQPHELAALAAILTDLHETAKTLPKAKRRLPIRRSYDIPA